MLTAARPSRILTAFPFRYPKAKALRPAAELRTGLRGVKEKNLSFGENVRRGSLNPLRGRELQFLSTVQESRGTFPCVSGPNLIVSMNSNYDFRIIRVLRRRLGLTLQALAGRAGLTYPTVESIETNKTLPSLKTLDALAGALQISTSDLLGLAERRLVQRRKANIEQRSHTRPADKGLENCRVARYDKGKIIRVTAEAGDHVHVMGLHEDVHEFCYVLSGVVELRIEDKTYRLQPDDTILFNGLLDHSYTQIEAGEYLTVHIPTDARIIEALLGGKSEDVPRQ
jgi:transcriptional regulator with XRE-family HTH domain